MKERSVTHHIYWTPTLFPVLIACVTGQPIILVIIGTATAFWINDLKVTGDACADFFINKPHTAFTRLFKGSVITLSPGGDYGSENDV
jgi:hypothetical protein